MGNRLLQRCLHLRYGFMLAICTFICIGRSAVADNFQWIVPPGGPPTAWQTPPAWNNLTTPGPGIPGASDSALFSDTGCCSLSSVTLLPIGPPPGNVTVQKLTFDSGIYDLSFLVPGQSVNVTGSDQFVIGQGTHAAELSLGSSGLPGTISVNGIFLGKDSGSVGILNLANGAAYSDTSTLRVGENGVGVLNLSSGATVVTTGRMFIASPGATSSGHVSVHSASLQIGQDIILGVNGQADLIVDSSGSFSAGTAYSIGSNSGSVATATISGAGSIMQAGWYMNIGQAGQGTVYVNNGGTVLAQQAINLGNAVGGVGTATVSGVGSVLHSKSFSLDIGTYGRGTLTVIDSGQALADQGIVIGDQPGSAGQATASGSGSKLQAGFSIDVGSSGQGTLDVDGGAMAIATNNLTIGYIAGSTGEVTVSGANSKVQSGWETSVGWNGQGTLTVDNGGLASSALDINLARVSGSKGTANIGSGGTVTTSGSTYVGGTSGAAGGAGVLNVNSGGTLNVAGTLGVWNAGSNKVNLAGGTINTTALNFNGNPSLLNWTSGTLNLSGNIGFASNAPGNTTSGAFGSGRSLAAGQTLKVTGNETLGTGGGPFNLTVNSGGMNIVTGQLFLNQLGTMTVNTGGSATVGTVLFINSAGKLNLAGGGMIAIGNIGLMSPAARSVLVGSGGFLNSQGAIIGDVVNNSGNVQTSNGAGGITSITGTFTQAAAGTLQIALGGTTRGTNYNPLVASGQASLGGTLQVTLSAFSPALGNIFDILDASSITGTFATVSLPALGSGLVWNASALYTTGVLSVAAGVPGDYNNNGLVDAADYVLWRKGGPLMNEVDAPGTVNGADYTAWRARFGNPSGTGTGLSEGSAAVPEPAAAVFGMMAMGAAFLGFGRRIRNRVRSLGAYGHSR